MHTRQRRRSRVSPNLGTHCFFHFNINFHQTKTPIIMADIDAVGSTRCIRFGDNTRPICHARGQLGHLCQPCSRESQAAQAAFDNGTPQERRELLQKENTNLRLVNVFANVEYEAEARTTEAWRRAVTAKLAERDTLFRFRDQSE